MTVCEIQILCRKRSIYMYPLRVFMLTVKKMKPKCRFAFFMLVLFKEKYIVIGLFALFGLSVTILNHENIIKTH